MKVSIRKGTFETNSSSTHSLVIAQSSDFEFPNSITFKVGEWGWEYGIHYGIEEKASYLYTYIMERITDDDSMRDIINQIYDWLSEDNIEVNFIEPGRDLYGYLKDGYIDHGGELIDFFNYVTHTKKNLYRFLFNSDSFIVTGNDNDDDAVDYKARELAKNYNHKYFEKWN